MCIRDRWRAYRLFVSSRNTEDGLQWWGRNVISCGSIRPRPNSPVNSKNNIKRDVRFLWTQDAEFLFALQTNKFYSINWIFQKLHVIVDLLAHHFRRTGYICYYCTLNVYCFFLGSWQCRLLWQSNSCLLTVVYRKPMWSTSVMFV